MGVLVDGAGSLSPICRNWTRHTMPGGGRWTETIPAEREEPSAALSSICPSSLSEKARGSRHPASWGMSESCRFGAACCEGVCRSAEWERAEEAAQIWE